MHHQQYASNIHGRWQRYADTSYSSVTISLNLQEVSNVIFLRKIIFFMVAGIPADPGVTAVVGVPVFVAIASDTADHGVPALVGIPAAVDIPACCC